LGTLRAVGAGPVAVADALGRLQVVDAVVGAGGQTLVDLLVDDVAPGTLPARLAVALAVDAGSVLGTGGVLAVRLVAGFALPAGLAVARASDALAVPGTVGHATVALGDVAFGSFPTLLAVAQSSAVLTVAGAEHRTHTCSKISSLQ
jgi:hypothetical protein